MIGTIAAGTSIPLVTLNLTKQKKKYAFKISIEIVGYLEAKYDYDYFILFCIRLPQLHTRNLKSFRLKLKILQLFL